MLHFYFLISGICIRGIQSSCIQFISKSFDERELKAGNVGALEKLQETRDCFVTVRTTRVPFE